MLYLLQCNSHSGLEVSDPIMYCIIYYMNCHTYHMLYMLKCNSYSGLKVSDPLMYYVLYVLSYIPYAIYVTKQFSFESERFRPHYVLYII